MTRSTQGTRKYEVATLDDGSPDLGAHLAASPRLAVKKALKLYRPKCGPDADVLLVPEPVPKNVTASTYRAGGETIRVMTADQYLEARNE